MGKLKKELLSVECEKMCQDIPLLDYIYIIPTRRKHDSGYMCMEIIGENKEGYKKKLATYCDVFDLGQIFTSRHQYFHYTIDVPEYGVLRLFSHQNRFRVEIYGLSSFVFDLIEKGNENESI